MPSATNPTATNRSATNLLATKYLGHEYLGHEFLGHEISRPRINLAPNPSATNSVYPEFVIMEKRELLELCEFYVEMCG